MPNVTGTVVRHNTFYNTPNLLINSGQSSAFIQNNILVGSAAMNTTANGGCLNCTVSFNMCQSSGCVEGGTTQIVGAPTFVGGSVPSTWAGWQLAAGSKGKNAGSDGQDVGTNYYGPVLGTAPSAPTNLRIIP
jgi:hypothetical protein